MGFFRLFLKKFPTNTFPKGGCEAVFSAQQYIKATSIQQALELNQKRTNAILGGGCWMRLGKKSYSTLIDLSGLGLDQIEENDDEISLGAMVTLRQMETSQLLNRYFGDFFVSLAYSFETALL